MLHTVILSSILPAIVLFSLSVRAQSPDVSPVNALVLSHAGEHRYREKTIAPGQYLELYINVPGDSLIAEQTTWLGGRLIAVTDSTVTVRLTEKTNDIVYRDGTVAYASLEYKKDTAVTHETVSLTTIRSIYHRNPRFQPIRTVNMYLAGIFVGANLVNLIAGGDATATGVLLGTGCIVVVLEFFTSGNYYYLQPLPEKKRKRRIWSLSVR